MTREWKPRFKVAAWRSVEPFVRDIADQLARRSYDNEYWPHVASDVLDGWARLNEVSPLVQRGVLAVINDGGCGCKYRCDEGFDLRECPGRYPTWHLTERGLRWLCPDHPFATTHPEKGR